MWASRRCPRPLPTRSGSTLPDIIMSVRPTRSSHYVFHHSHSSSGIYRGLSSISVRDYVTFATPASFSDEQRRFQKTKRTEPASSFQRKPLRHGVGLVSTAQSVRNLTSYPSGKSETRWSRNTNVVTPFLPSRAHGSHHHGGGGLWGWVKKKAERKETDEHGEHDHAHDHKHETQPVSTVAIAAEEDTPQAKKKRDQDRQMKTITYVGLLTNVGLAVVKYIAGVLGHSEAMVADAIHSLTDVISDLVTLWALRMSTLPHDPEYPYGRGKFETVGTFFVAMTLVGTGVGLGGHALQQLMAIEEVVPTSLAVYAAVGSILFKELLYHVTAAIGRKHQSDLLIANAWHHRSDSLSSFVALLGITGAMLGVPWLDPVAGAAVGVMIIKMGAEMGWTSIKELTDASLDREMLTQMGELIMTVDGIVQYGKVRSRKMGTYRVVDVEIEVDPLLSVSAAHQIAQRVRLKLLTEIPQLNEVLVHVDPEPESCNQETLETLMRPQSEIAKDVVERLANFPEIEGMSFLCCHYYHRRLTVEVDIVLKDKSMSIADAQELSNRVQREVMMIRGIDYADILTNLSMSTREKDERQQLVQTNGKKEHKGEEEEERDWEEEHYIYTRGEAGRVYDPSPKSNNNQ